MTLAQRRSYNEYKRLKYLRNRIRDGFIPQPKKPLTPKQEDVYRQAGIEQGVYFPQDWMPNDLIKALRRDKAKMFEYVRDQLPAEYSTNKVKQILVLLIRGEIEIEHLSRLK